MTLLTFFSCFTPWTVLVSPYTVNRDRSVTMVGISGSGKSSILHWLRYRKFNTELQPTFGFDIDTIEYNGINCTIWDYGGHQKIRPFWHQTNKVCRGLIFVIDSSDREGIIESLEELQKIRKKEEIKDVPVLVFANKRDLEDIMTLEEIRNKLRFSDIPKEYIHLQPSIARKGEGILEGLKWLTERIKSEDRQS